MIYYWFNTKDLLKTAHKMYHEEGGKERANEYYQKHKKKL